VNVRFERIGLSGCVGIAGYGAKCQKKKKKRQENQRGL